MLQKITNKFYGGNRDLDEDANSLREDFEIDTEDESYEKISVPNFAGGRRSRFIHDFNSVSIQMY